MIIKGYRWRAHWHLKRFCDHVFRGPENEEVRVLQGSERDLADFQKTAQQAGRTNGMVASEEVVEIRRPDWV